MEIQDKYGEIPGEEVLHSDSEDSLFLTQKDVPQAVRSKRLRRRSWRSTRIASRFLEDSGSSSNSEDDSRRRRNGKTSLELPQYKFPFLKDNKPRTNEFFGVVKSTALHYHALAGFFHCVRGMWPNGKRNKCFGLTLPTVDAENEEIAPISEAEKSDNEDITIIDRKLFVHSLKPEISKSFQPWFDIRRKEINKTVKLKKATEAKTPCDFSPQHVGHGNMVTQSPFECLQRKDDKQLSNNNGANLDSDATFIEDYEPSTSTCIAAEGQRDESEKLTEVESAVYDMSPLEDTEIQSLQNEQLDMCASKDNSNKNRLSRRINKHKDVQLGLQNDYLSKLVDEDVAKNEQNPVLFEDNSTNCPLHDENRPGEKIRTAIEDYEPSSTRHTAGEGQKDPSALEDPTELEPAVYYVSGLEEPLDTESRSLLQNKQSDISASKDNSNETTLLKKKNKKKHKDVELGLRNQNQAKLINEDAANNDSNLFLFEDNCTNCPLHETNRPRKKNRTVIENYEPPSSIHTAVEGQNKQLDISASKDNSNETRLLKKKNKKKHKDVELELQDENQDEPMNEDATKNFCNRVLFEENSTSCPLQDDNRLRKKNRTGDERKKKKKECNSENDNGTETEVNCQRSNKSSERLISCFEPLNSDDSRIGTKKKKHKKDKSDLEIATCASPEPIHFHLENWKNVAVDKEVSDITSHKRKKHKKLREAPSHSCNDEEDVSLKKVKKKLQLFNTGENGLSESIVSHEQSELVNHEISAPDSATRQSDESVSVRKKKKKRQASFIVAETVENSQLLLSQPGNGPEADNTIGISTNEPESAKMGGYLQDAELDKRAKRKKKHRNDDTNEVSNKNIDHFGLNAAGTPNTSEKLEKKCRLSESKERDSTEMAHSQSDEQEHPKKKKKKTKHERHHAVVERADELQPHDEVEVEASLINPNPTETSVRKKKKKKRKYNDNDDGIPEEEDVKRKRKLEQNTEKKKEKARS